MQNQTGRFYLDAAVAERATHASAEDVRVTCSFARAERLLGREYHGRFLIELLQNAADAWRNDPRSVGERSRVAVVITEEPALLVANQGSPMTAQVLIDSIGHIGASTKSEGEAIGHKGIGFKSVLELTLAPEIYSGLQQPEPDLAASFDPAAALELIRASTTGPGGESWDDLVDSVEGLDRADPLAGVPVLRFPRWVDDPPADVRALQDDGFDTVVRLPFRQEYADRLRLDRDTWGETVRAAVADVSDQILLLLGCFSEVRFDDHAADDQVTVVPEWQDEPTSIAGNQDGPTREVVTVRRNAELSTRWRLYRRELPDATELAGEIAVGVRLSPDEADPAVMPAIDGEASAPFHLFFPTRIPSGLPFLAHGYFEVDAARTGFYRGSASRNEQILEHLAALVAEAVRDTADASAADLASLVDSVATADEPSDPMAQRFRSHVLVALDDVAWIPLATADKARCGRPCEVFVGLPLVTRLAGRVFPPAFVEDHIGLGMPADRLSDEALELVRSRHPHDAPDEWESLAKLCRPGRARVWDDTGADQGFLALLDLLAALEVQDREKARELVDGLRGDPHSTLLPAVGLGDSRGLLPVPDPHEGVAGNRSQLVMARVRAAGSAALVPPDQLEVAFLADGLLAHEQEIDRAKPLGVRPFTVDNVLDRLNGIGETDVDPPALLRFLWMLLVRERVSGFGTRRSAERAALFDPAQWFWCRPGRAREDETARLRQQRERFLADVPLPARDGTWHPAGQLAFGADWAQWIESGALGSVSAPAQQERTQAYQALEALSPSSDALLAPPHVVFELLGDEAFDPAGFVDTEGDAPAVEVPADDTQDEEPHDHAEDLGQRSRRDAERHAFLLRLGVWEVPPVEAFESRETGKRDHAFPWGGDVADAQLDACRTDEKWVFGLEDWGGGQHHNVYLGEDYRFRWSLTAMATRDADALLTALCLGARLYSERITASVFCTGCGDSGSSHRAWRQSTPADGFPSWLALQLRREPWVPCTRDGSPGEHPVPPTEAWWLADPPTGAGLRQSPWRFVALCGPSTGLTDSLRALADINTLSDAHPATVEGLLEAMRADFEHVRLNADPLTSGSAHQAFLGIHRLAYERLADLAALQSDEVTAVLERCEILCELGDDLVYQPVPAARHDDGRFSPYVRHFLGVTPFAVLARDREVTATRLGIAPFSVNLARHGTDDGRDVTDEVRSFLGDRFAELLSIVVHHSLGSQTLEVTSKQFDDRVRRLKALSVRQMDDLIVTATEEGSGHQVTIGVGADRDLFLEGPTSVAPVLFLDLIGVGWQDRLRRRIAPHLAAILENPAYHHTFALFLQADSDAEREEFLLELGITGDEIDAIASRIGVVSEEEQLRHRHWFAALIAARNSGQPVDARSVDLEPEALTARLTEAGYATEVARRLVEAGGGEAVRRATDDHSPLCLLASVDVALEAIDTHLRGHGDPGLSIPVARRRFAHWMNTYERHLAAVVATRRPADESKALVGALRVPDSLAFDLEPDLADLLEPVIGLLESIELHPENAVLVEQPEAELARLAGVADLAALDQMVLLLFDEEEQRRVLHERAGQWRRELRLLAVLNRTGPFDTRATIRAYDEAINGLLPVNPLAPSELIEEATKLFIDRSLLTVLLAEQLAGALTAPPPDRDVLMQIAAEDGLAVERLAIVQRALETSLRKAQELVARSKRLAEAGIAPTPPKGLVAAPLPPPKPSDGPKTVADVKVGEGHDRQKKQLGDEGELWALAAVIDRLMTVAHEDMGAFEAAIDDILALLAHFVGKPVEAVRSHAELARSRGLDDDERVQELTELLHVSRQSDAFGFDLLGWLPDDDSADGSGRAVCLEVKSSSGEAFHLSSGEWGVAQRLHNAEIGHQYAVLVVRRAKSGGVPAGMDLLADPIHLKATNQLRLDVDTYSVSYTAAPAKH